jgi:surfactin synthase thioesterase subunit
MKLLLTLCAALLLAGNAFGSDLEKEKRWANQTVDSIIDGEAVWLNDGENEFLGIYTEANEDKERAVIVMHGTGIHPNWQQVIMPLRVGLIEHNWNTLSIQMPILRNEAEYAEYAPLFDEVAPRINAAVAFLKENGSDDIMLIGHSLGAAMAAYYLTHPVDDDIEGFVAIGMGALASDRRMNGAKSLELISVPVLDLYGTEDLESVLETVDARAAAAKKAGNEDYSQVQIKGNHFFDGQEDVLVETVAEWLEDED